MITHVLAEAQTILRKPRGVHINATIVAGVVEYEIWDRHGKVRFQGRMAVEDFDDDTVALAWSWLESKDPTPPAPGPRAHLRLHGSTV